MTNKSKLDYSLIRNVIRSSPYQQALYRSSINNDFERLVSKLTDTCKKLNVPGKQEGKPSMLEGRNCIQETCSDQNQTHCGQKRKVHTFTATFEIPDHDNETSTETVSTHSAANARGWEWGSKTKPVLSNMSSAASAPLIKKTRG